MAPKIPLLTLEYSLDLNRRKNGSAISGRKLIAGGTASDWTSAQSAPNPIPQLISCRSTLPRSCRGGHISYLVLLSPHRWSQKCLLGETCPLFSRYPEASCGINSVLSTFSNCWNSASWRLLDLSFADQACHMVCGPLMLISFKSPIFRKFRLRAIQPDGFDHFM